MGIDLNKRSERVRIVLEKRKLPVVPKMRVGLALDISGSAEGLYRSGVMQETVERLLAVAMRFDDNGEMDMWAFHNRQYSLPVATAKNFENYVQRDILNNDKVRLWGGTEYAPVLGSMEKHWFGGAPAARPAPKGFFGKLFSGASDTSPSPARPADNSPALGMLITDGSNSDPREAAEFLRFAQDRKAYWLMVGVGNPKEFTFLERMADELPHVGFVSIANLTMTDDQLYEAMLSEELCTWVGKQ